MRRRRQARTPASALRRLALAGRWDEVRTLLEERLARDPHDAEARAELERLRQGVPLRAAESALVRKRREEQEMQEELTAELALFSKTPDMLSGWETPLLTRRHKRIARIRSTLGKRLPAELRAEAAVYFRALSSERAQRNRKRRLLVGAAIGLPLLLLAGAATALPLHHRAQQAEESLRHALQARDMGRVEKALHRASSGTNRLFNRELTELIHQAENWQARCERRQAELQELLAELETGKTQLSALPLVRRAELNHTLNALPDGAHELRERWQHLCRREARALARQREEVLQRFRQPLPPMPELRGIPEEDDERLLMQLNHIRPLSEEWKAARELFSADEALGRPLLARRAKLEQLRADIAHLRHTVTLLPIARNYAQYCKALENYSPQLYPPTLRLAAIRALLPEEDKLRDHMQDHGRQLPPGMAEAARKALLHGGPSFPPAFPANARQVQVMEDLFTDTALQKALYELSAPTLPSFIVETRPEVRESSVSFSPSPLTPGYSLDVPRRITWHNPQGVFIRRLDATPLLRDTGINREEFFSKGNLPALLDALLRVRHQECPELARAYVFKRLLEVIRAHEWPTMLGIAYAPTLRADARAFATFTRELGIPLEAGCWLKNSPETERAEEFCATWFQERRHRQYAQEIARNFASLVQVHPRYIGYVGESGEPRLYRELPEGTLLWYVGEGGLTTTPMGAELESPALYSPIFIVAKD